MAPSRRRRSRRGATSGEAALPPIRKSLGQHFLTDPGLLGRIAAALGATGRETIIEIGPGRGALTDHLVERAGNLVAVEYDRALAAYLRSRYAGAPTVRIVEADVLTTPLATFAQSSEFLVAGNIPYHITTPILFHLLATPRPVRSVLLVQREVGDRLCASPGDEGYGALSVNVAVVARVERLFHVPAGAFRPPPRVDSTVVRIEPLIEPIVSPDEEAPYRALVQAAFSHRRKQMRRVVRSLFDLGAEASERLLSAAGIDPMARPEVVSPAAFAALFRRQAANRDS